MANHKTSTIVFPRDRLIYERKGFFRPGGPGDRLAFGYMFRFIAGVVSVSFASVVVFILTIFNDWTLPEGSIVAGSVIAGLMIAFGEILRIKVYEARFKEANSSDSRLSGVISKIDRAIESEFESLIERDEYNPNSFIRSYIRFIDVLSSAIALLFFTPLIVVIAALIRFDSGGPVVFKIKRYDYSGNDLNIFKFRTSVTINGTAHVTPVGQFLRRTSLDALPTVLNVIIGDLALIGPPPLLHPIDPEKKLIKGNTMPRPGLIFPMPFPSKNNKEAVRYFKFVKRFSLITDSKIFTLTAIKLIIGLFR